MSCCHLAWHNFQKYVKSDPCKEQKPCEKWMNDNTFLAISDFWSEKHWELACIYTRPKTSEDFGRLRKTSVFFGRLRIFFGNLRKWLCRLRKFWHSQDKNLTFISQKKLAGICGCWVERCRAGYKLLLHVNCKHACFPCFNDTCTVKHPVSIHVLHKMYILLFWPKKVFSIHCIFKM